MSASEENKALLWSYIEEVWDKQNAAAIDTFLAENYKRHRSPTRKPLNRQEQKQLLIDFRQAFPDAELTLEEVIAEDNRVAFRSTIRATHQGAFLGIAPTGKKVTVGLVDVIHIKNGAFVEQWGGPDLFDMMQQLGAEFSVRE